MGCSCDVNNPSTYLSCAGDQVRLIAPTAVMTTFAAQAGASSSNFSMCLTMMFLSSRRMQYWKVNPGDCGSPGTAILGSTFKVQTGVQTGLRIGASVDPEPISKGILAGVASIFGGFTAAHAAAVSTEQQTLCGVTGSFNYVLIQLENAVSSGQVSAVNAAAILEQAFNQLNPSLTKIKKGQNAAWGYQIGMTALKNFEEQVVFPALESLAHGQVPTVSSLSPSIGPTIPASVPTLPNYIPPVQNINPLPIASGYQGASGYTVAPLTGGNQGMGETSGILPFSLTPGTIILIGGIAFVASRF
jgi:hypothetical protein